MVKRHYGVRTERYKLIHFYDDIDQWELYDLQTDPTEMNNLFDKPGYESICRRRLLCRACSNPTPRSKRLRPLRLFRDRLLHLSPCPRRGPHLHRNRFLRRSPPLRRNRCQPRLKLRQQRARRQRACLLLPSTLRMRRLFSACGIRSPQHFESRILRVAFCSWVRRSRPILKTRV